ncbi:MAG TPA: NAD(P)H-dependent oxidoreductase, partial [Candidatus Paceibacterota bacterium]|nr:NAD(P)H-dependent oxidoreductase [Candidatus Paceibacterota bacterium]
MNIKIKVIVGSTREGRFSEHAAAWIARLAAEKPGTDVELVDLRDYDMPFFDAAVTPSAKTEPYENEAVARFTAKVNEADGFIVVTPEYNHGPSAVLKNAFDWVSPEWNKKAVAFVSYGTVGGARAVEQLRLVAVELQMAPIRQSIQITGERFYPVKTGKASAN